MTDCPLERIADPWWLCPQCGWLYYGEKAPRRNCPKAPKTEADTRARVEAELEAATTEGIPFQTPEQMRATLDACFGGCEHFSGNSCKLHGKGAPCNAHRIWLDVVMLTGCPHANTVGTAQCENAYGASR